MGKGRMAGCRGDKNIYVQVVRGWGVGGTKELKSEGKEEMGLKERERVGYDDK